MHIVPVNQTQLVAFHVTDENILCHTQLGIGRAVLINGSNTVSGGVAGVSEKHFLPIDNDLAFIRHMHTGDDFDQRGLTGAVFPHQRMDLAFSQFKLHIVQGSDTRESLGDIF